jgi:hypothetical protein
MRASLSNYGPLSYRLAGTPSYRYPHRLSYENGPNQDLVMLEPKSSGNIRNRPLGFQIFKPRQKIPMFTLSKWRLKVQILGASKRLLGASMLLSAGLFAYFRVFSCLLECLFASFRLLDVPSDISLKTLPSIFLFLFCFVFRLGGRFS